MKLTLEVSESSINRMREEWERIPLTDTDMKIEAREFCARLKIHDLLTLKKHIRDQGAKSLFAASGSTTIVIGEILKVLAAY